MDQLFPGANVVAGALVLIVGFGLQFGGQLISVVNSDLATRWGLQESPMPPRTRPTSAALRWPTCLGLVLSLVSQ